ncbi:MAG: hypothetical protein ACC656_08955 [Candidatus Heimdallarchaeota archaeon]
MDKAAFKQQFMRKKIIKKLDYFEIKYMKDEISSTSGELNYVK